MVTPEGIIETEIVETEVPSEVEVVINCDVIAQTPSLKFSTSVTATLLVTAVVGTVIVKILPTGLWPSTHDWPTSIELIIDEATDIFLFTIIFFFTKFLLIRGRGQESYNELWFHREHAFFRKHQTSPCHTQ